MATTVSAYLTGFGSYLPGDSFSIAEIASRLGGDDAVTERQHLQRAACRGAVLLLHPRRGETHAHHMLGCTVQGWLGGRLGEAVRGHGFPRLNDPPTIFNYTKVLSDPSAHW